MGAIEDHNIYGLTIRESATDGSDFTNPGADFRRLFLGEDGQLHVKDSAGTVTDIGSGSGNVATDAIWDAKGDLVAGTGANTSQKLTVGTNDLALIAASGETTGLKWAHPVLTSSSSILGAPVTLTNANQWYDGPTLSLAAGTWLVLGQMLMTGNSAANHQLQTRLYNSTGAAVLAETQTFAPDGNFYNNTVMAVVTLGSTSTIKLQGCNVIATVGEIESDLGANGNAKATIITAVRIA